MRLSRFFCMTGMLVLSHPMWAQDVLASVELEARDAQSVRIEGKFVDVDITKGASVYLKGIIEGRGDEGDYEFRTGMQGDQLVVQVIRNVRSWDRLYRSQIELTLPDGIAVRVDNSSGDVTAEGIRSESIWLETTSGDIEVSDVDGQITLESTSGDVELEEVSGDIDTESTSGDLNVNGFMGRMKAKSTSGDIEISSFDGDVVASATSGDIEVRRGAGQLRIRASSGDVDGYGVELTGDSEFRTSSGNIEMEFENDLDELSFDLEASSGNLSVGSRRAEKTLYMKQGGIWIRGISSSGNQRYQ